MERRSFLKQSVQLGAAALLPTAPSWAAGVDDGVGSQSLTLGSSLALSGPLAASGREALAGMSAAVQAANQAGGVNGREIKLEARDDAYQPAKSLDNVKQILSQGSCLAMLSCMGTATTAAALPLIEQAGMPLVGPITGAVSLRQAGLRNVFHVRASYGEETNRAVQQLVSMGLKDIAVVHLDNSFGKEILREADAALQAKQLRATGSYAVALDGSNVNSVVQALLASKPSAVLVGTAGTVGLQLVSSLRRQVAGLPIVALSIALVSSDLAQLGSAAQGLAITQVMPDPDRSRLGVSRAYQAAMKAAGESAAMGSLSFEGWMNAQVMLEGLRRAGRDLNRDKLRQSLAAIRRLDLGDFSLGFANAAPYVASSFVDLAILGVNGKRMS